MTELKPTPYADAANLYRAAGWLGVLPLPLGAKTPPPPGYTGRAGLWPSTADVQAWREDIGGGNVALRLPRDVIGIDVDNYGDKQGEATIGDALKMWGALPPTWRSTSRDDSVSGIYLYRVPPGLAWPGVLGDGVEIIQWLHRYAVVWPSVHPSGGVYRWHHGNSVAMSSVPNVAGLPNLPESWVAGLTQGRADDDLVKVNLDDLEANAWLIAHGGGEQCAGVRSTVDHYLAERLTGAGSRHDAARDATARLMHMATEGHTGVVSAVNEIGVAFRALVEDDKQRATDSAEWARLYLGAIRLAARVIGTNDDAGRDPCVVPEVTVLSVPSPTPMESQHGLSTNSVGITPAKIDHDQLVAPAAPSAGVIDVGTMTPEQARAIAERRVLDAEVALQRTRRQARKILDAEEVVATFRPPVILPTLTDELAVHDEPVRYLIDEVFPADGNVTMTAAFKTGKTTLINHLARCLVDNEPFLGRFAVRPDSGRVGIFNYEVSAAQYRAWLRSAGIVNTSAVSVWHLRGHGVPLGTPEVVDQVVRWLAEAEISTWIVDPFARALSGFGDGNENDNGLVGRFLDTLDVIKERAGVRQLVIPMHTGRAEAEIGAERARGATRADDWTDARWLLTRDVEGNRYFRATGRDVEVEEFQLSYDEETRQPSASGKAGRRLIGVEALDARILGIIETTPGLGFNEIMIALGREDATGARRANVKAACNRLVGLRQIRTEPGPRNGLRHYRTGPSVLTRGVTYE